VTPDRSPLDDLNFRTIAKAPFVEERLDLLKGPEIGGDQIELVYPVVQALGDVFHQLLLRVLAGLDFKGDSFTVPTGDQVDGLSIGFHFMRFSSFTL